MNDDEIEGKGENLKGRVKQAAGTVTGNKSVEADGALDRAKGAVKEKVGEIKRRLNDDDNEDEV